MAGIVCSYIINFLYMMSSSSFSVQDDGVHDEMSTPSVFKPSSRPETQATTSDTSSETASSEHNSEESDKLDKMAAAFRTIMECCGEDVNRDGVLATPMRAAKAMSVFTSGYCQTIDDVVGGGIFHEETNGDMVIVRNIDISSLCEHHMVPFFGKVHIGYIPNGKVLGLSKLSRIATLYSRRLQLQERLTNQIAQAIMDKIEPLGVGVVVECTHMCMVMRGVEKNGSSTITSTVLGNFKSDRDVRKEFLDAVRNK